MNQQSCFPRFMLPGLAAGLYLPKSVWTLEQEPLC